MLIDWIDIDAPRALLSSLEAESAAQRESLHFRTPQSALPLDVDDIVRYIYPPLSKSAGVVYQFDDGELVISWNKGSEETYDDLRFALYEVFEQKRTSTLATRHDHKSDLAVLRRLATSKDPSLGSEEKKPAFRPRSTRTGMLIVDHDDYARKAFSTALPREYEYHYTADVERAIDLYTTHQPALVFVDVELADGKGHSLAATLRKMDADCHIVMVSSTQRPEDIQTALENGAQGFIVKPYTKQKIEGCMRKCFGEKKS